MPQSWAAVYPPVHAAASRTRLDEREEGPSGHWLLGLTGNVLSVSYGSTYPLDAGQPRRDGSLRLMGTPVQTPNSKGGAWFALGSASSTFRGWAMPSSSQLIRPSQVPESHWPGAIHPFGTVNSRPRAGANPKTCKIQPCKTPFPRLSPSPESPTFSVKGIRDERRAGFFPPFRFACVVCVFPRQGKIGRLIGCHL